MAHPVRGAQRLRARLPALLPLTLALLAFVFFLLEGISVMYHRVAESAAQRETTSQRALQSGHYAATLAPWSDRRQLDYAWSLAVAGDRSDYARSIGKALRWAPASAYAWHLHAHALILQREFNAELVSAVRRINNLAPHSPALQSQLALSAAEHWSWAPQALREEWLASARYTMRVLPRAYLEEVLRRGRAPHFCASVAEQLEVGDWCDQAATAIRACRGPNLRPQQFRWCESMNLLP